MEQTPFDSDQAAQRTELVHIDASFEPLIPKFMNNRKKEVLAMQDAVTAQDLEIVRKIAHSMKGAGGSYGFDRITELAASIEQAAKQSDAAAVRHALPSLQAYLERIEVVYD